MTTTATPRKIQIGGVGLHVEAPTGDGDPLVIVHGAWTDHTAFDAVVEPLARSFTVIRYDRRGHTRSDYGGPAPRRRDEDDLTSPAWLRLVPIAVATGAGIATRTIHGAGHSPHLTHPDALVAVVEAFARPA